MISSDYLNEIVVLTGVVKPRSSVGSLYSRNDKEIRVVTWRGDREWASRWEIRGKTIYFSFIKSPEGTVINWGSKKSLRRFIPSRHIDIINEIAKKHEKLFFEWELK